MKYKVSFTNEFGPQTLILEPRDEPLTIKETDLWEIVKDPYRSYTEEELLVIQQLLEEYPTAKDIDISKYNPQRRQNTRSTSSSGNGGLLIGLGLIIAVLFAPIIIAFGMYGKGLLKGLYSDALNLERFKRFRRPYLVFGFELLISCIFAGIVLILRDFPQVFMGVFISLFVGNIVFFIVGIRKTKKIIAEGDSSEQTNTPIKLDSKQLKKKKRKKVVLMILCILLYILGFYCAGVYSVLLVSELIRIIKGGYEPSPLFFVASIMTIISVASIVLTIPFYKNDFRFLFFAETAFSLGFVEIGFLFTITFNPGLVWEAILGVLSLALFFYATCFGFVINRNARIKLQRELSTYQPKGDEFGFNEEEYNFDEEEYNFDEDETNEASN